MQSLFVSSTFKDMQGERDALHRLVIPRLREKARRHNEVVQFVDLRWGISTSDMDSDEGASKILEVCLDEIRQCKPYMIVLLGERYGWMPSPALLRGSAEGKNFSLESYEMSVTELEIQYGLYLAQGQIDRCVFCLRDSFPEDTLPEDLWDIYVADSEEDRQRMQRLREKICNTPGANVIHYHLDWDAEKQDFTGYEAFADRLTETLENILSAEWKIQGRRSWRARQREDDKLLIKMHQKSFVGRQTQIQNIMEAIDSHQVVILEGEGGCGKSALMAQLLKRYEDRAERNTAVDMYCCGNSSYCMNVAQLMHLMLFRLFVLEGDGYLFERIINEENLHDYFDAYMEKFSRTKVIFFIDAIDQLSPDQGLYESWFVPTKISENIKLVISTTGTVRVNPMALPKGNNGVASQVIHLGAPEAEDLRKILEARFLAEHKQISKVVADKILENPCSKNMLGMEIMVRRLVMLSKKDFQKIAELEKTMDGNQAIDTYLLQIIEEMPQNLYQLNADYMEEVASFLDDTQTFSLQLFQHLVALMQHGISVNQIENLASYTQKDKNYNSIPEDHLWRRFWDPVLFARMKQYMGSLMVQRLDGRVDYSHRLLRQAILSQSVTKHIAQVVAYWMLFEPQEDINRLENILVLARHSEDCNKSRYKDYEINAGVMESFFQETISTAGNLEIDPDPKNAEEGKRQLEILQRSILSDLGGEEGVYHLDTYCDILDAVIRGGRSANYYMVWFFGVRMCELLEKQGEREKAMAIQILCRIVASLDAQKKEFEAGKTEYAANWTIRKKSRMLQYYTRLLRLLADAYQSIKLGIVKTRNGYGLDIETVFNRGIAMAEECIAEEPDNALQYIRKAYLYSDYAALSKATRWGKKENKQTRLVEQAMECVESALHCAENEEEKEKYSDRSGCVYVISRCIRVMTEAYKNMVIPNKKILEKAEQYFEKAWSIVEAADNREKLEVEDVAQLMVAWGKLYDQKGNALSKKQDMYRQIAIDRLFDYYYEIRTKHRDDIPLKPKARDALAAIAVNIYSISAYGILPKTIKDMGEKYGRSSLLLYLVEKEGGYLQAQARSDFTSRWHWAKILCAEVLYYSNRNSRRCVETGERVIPILETLLEESKKMSCPDVSESEITSERDFMQKLVKQAREKLEQPAKA